MAEKRDEPITGIDGGTGLMELSASVDNLAADALMAPAPGAAGPEEKGLRRMSDARAGAITVSRPASLTLGPVREAEGTPAAAHGGGLWRMVHGALRGRYWWVVPVSLATGMSLAAWTWKQTKPSFGSDGLIQIAYTMPKVLGETDQNGPLPLYDTFMQSQKTLITSRRVLDAATKSTAWAEEGRVAPVDTATYYARHMTLDVRAPFIKINVRDADAATATAAVKAIVRAYKAQYAEQEQQLDRQRLGLLEDRREVLAENMTKLRNQINQKATEYGTTELGPFYASWGMKAERLEIALTEVQMAIAGVAPANTQPAAILREGTPASAALNQTPVEQIANQDPVMRAYLDNQMRLQADLDRLLVNYGPAHRVVQAARAELEHAKSRVSSYADVYRQTHALSAPIQSLASGGGPAPMKSLGSLRSTEVNLASLLEKARQEMMAIGKAKLVLDQLLLERETARAELLSVTQRIDMLRGEGALGGRMSVISEGETQVAPEAGSKRMQLMGATALGGMLLPAGLVVAFSTVRRRFRYSRDAMEQMSTMGIGTLGVIPDLGQGKAKSGSYAAGGYAMHHLRVLLTSVGSRLGRRTYLVTSAGPQDGRTSVVMGLAVSMAAAKLRTLVIDADFVSGCVTEGMAAVNRDGLYEAMESPVSTPAPVEASSYLHVLPTGRTTAADACGISRGGLQALASTSFKEYDVILIDSGPVLESLEAGVLAQEVDGVIVVVSRNQRAGLVKHAVRRLESLGAPILGAVFNRARMDDFLKAEGAFGGSARPVSPVNAPTELQERVSRFGPLVRATAATSQ